MALDLSVAIIFKNEIRCIERCLKSLVPLKERCSCEIVMADTGATDGSRAVAEQYADVLIDFPWINDFAAARNAVLERCRGRWTLVIDCDEWLDEDIGELAEYVRDNAKPVDYVLLTVRNYYSETLDVFSDFRGYRLLRMGSKPIYRGAIHERVIYRQPTNKEDCFYHTILHHDGYLMLHDGSAEGKAKRERNRELLREELQKSPNSIRTLLQYVEASEHSDEDYMPTLLHVLALVEEKKPEWQTLGPIVYSRAVAAAYQLNLPEFKKWSERARSSFSSSYFTRIGIAFYQICDAIKREDYISIINLSEAYLMACKEFQDDPAGQIEISRSELTANRPGIVQFVRLHLARAYCEMREFSSALSLLNQTEWTLLDKNGVQYFIAVARMLGKNGIGVGELLSECWNGIQQPVPSAERAQERMDAFKELIHVGDSPLVREPPRTELVRLAARVKSILEMYPSNDPAVIELKKSTAYQKVAYLIEGGVPSGQ